MAIQRYTASLDTTITNAYKMDLQTRATGSNMGLADTLEVFSIYGQESSASSELSRILVQFPVTEITKDRTIGNIPASGSVNFFLKMYNAEHYFTTPRDFSLTIAAITKSWQEGRGLDMDEYTDRTYDGIGSNWIKASEGQGDSTSWERAGGDFYSDVKSSFTASFKNGTEDLEADITTLVEQWLNSAGNVLGSKTNYGVLVKFPDAKEAATRSYYTKKFFSRSSEFVLKRPIIEARWDSSIRDDRGNFFKSSSLADDVENINTIYLYNNIRGRLRNIPVVGTSPNEILVSIYSGSIDNSEKFGSKITLPIGGGVVANNDTNVTGGYSGTTGIYSASFAYTGSATTIFAVWHNESLGKVPEAEFRTGSAIEVKTFESLGYNPHPDYVTTITNLKDSYSLKDGVTRFRLYIRERDWTPNSYTRVTGDIASSTIEDGYFKLYRTTDEFQVVGYGTGSTNHTRLSYDISGSYFDFPINVLEAGYMYAFKFLYKMPDGNYREQSETFKFRVD